MILKRWKTIAALFLSALSLVGCIITDGSSVVVGDIRPQTNASEIKLYTNLPAKYEEIAIISSESAHDFVSKQALVDAAIKRLKEEAAKVGANGILLDGVGNYYIGSSGVVTIPNANSNVAIGGASMNARTGKEAKGMAIYVIQE